MSVSKCLQAALVLALCSAVTERVSAADSFAYSSPTAVKATPVERIADASPDNLPSSLFRAYMHLRNIQFSYLNLQEHSSDQTMVPTRGPDWGDGGIWRELTQHEWTPSHPEVANTWNYAYQGVHYTNVVLPGLEEAAGRSDEEFPEQVVAEVRVLRAFFFYTLLDLFGNVPLTTTRTASKAMIAPEEVDVEPEQASREEVFNFILSELNNAIDSGSLPSAQDYGVGRVTESAANALRARLLINAEIYSGGARYQEALVAAEQVLNSGHFTLEEDYYANFTADNHTSSEIILAVPFEREQGEGYVKTQSVLHYNHPLPVTPWNGFTTIAAFYESFDTEPGPDGELGTQDDVHNDVRGKQFLAGKQWSEPSEGCVADNCFSDSSSSPITVRGSDTQVDFTLDIPSLILTGDAADLENPGARPMKFEVDPNATDANMGNDYPLVRLAEIYLIRAEAAAVLGQNAEAADALNTVRVRAGIEPVSAGLPLMELLGLIFQERGREFHFETLRRQDLIRAEFTHGVSSSSDPYAPGFTDPWLFKEQSEEFRTLFPIPQEAIAANPNLAQNPGY